MKVNTEFTLEATPEKIYTMLKLIAFGRYTKAEILKMIQPQKPGDGSVLSYIEQCEWAMPDDEGKYKLLIDTDILSDIQTFRKHINKRLFEGNKTWYFEFTKWYMSQNEEILKYTLNDVQKSGVEVLRGENDNAILYWRLWSSFLGFGMLQKIGKSSKFVPNPYVRMKDVMELDEDLARNQEIPVKDFITWLRMNCPELVDCIKGQEFTVFLSLALRVLHDMNVITLINRKDATDIWYLTKEAYHDIQSRITHIEVKGA